MHIWSSVQKKNLLVLEIMDGFSRCQLHRFSACSRGNIARKNKEAYYLYAALKPRSSQASKT